MLPSIIPIFPLPNVVLFPSVFLPLHIFERRYRRMLADAESAGVDFLIHIGDILGTSCSDEKLRELRSRMDGAGVCRTLSIAS